VGTGLAVGLELGDGPELVGVSLGMLLASELFSAEVLEVAFTVVGSGMALGLELGDGLVVGPVGVEVSGSLSGLVGVELGIVLG
jgi:hypothetical protein